uniref:Uncharacterized protein n=1 Tax=Yersinia enterocolitica TaxID=630 RepID=B0RKQ5_YEREN|nr:hypothetical protein [Yersinia enterocolitica]
MPTNYSNRSFHSPHHGTSPHRRRTLSPVHSAARCFLLYRKAPVRPAGLTQ